MGGYGPLKDHIVFEGNSTQHIW